jgi:hypothetical protein
VPGQFPRILLRNRAPGVDVDEEIEPLVEHVHEPQQMMRVLVSRHQERVAHPTSLPRTGNRAFLRNRGF